MAYTFHWNESRFVARSGGTNEVDLIFPTDFPGHPALSSSLEVEIESVAVRLITSAVAATRRVVVEALTDQAFVQSQWVSGASTLLSLTRRYQFSRDVNTEQVAQAGLELNKETLPRMVLGQPWTLRVRIGNFQAGDVLDEVIVQGKYLV